jgi:transcriptional regulator with GAF, ATPase, and Fis domain
MVDNESFNRDLAAAAREMQAEHGPQDTMDTAVRLAPQVIDDCNVAGVSIFRRDGIETLSATEPSLRESEQLQFTFREGPCYDALAEQEMVHSKDLAADHRWPNWGPRVADKLGLHSSVSFRLFASGDTLGSMNLYSYKPEAFTTADIHEGIALAAHVAVALAGSQQFEHMQLALQGRTVIGQAEGILMERFSLSGDQAFSVLTRLSQSHNVKLRDIAGQIVDTRRLPS